MSRIGKLPITIPEKVNVTVSGSSVSVKGLRANLTMNSMILLNLELKIMLYLLSQKKETLLQRVCGEPQER